MYRFYFLTLLSPSVVHTPQDPCSCTQWTSHGYALNFDKKISDVYLLSGIAAGVVSLRIHLLQNTDCISQHFLGTQQLQPLADCSR